eukprot:TRINITY_DN3326_c0_g1_i1.p1 TRINITY_DN3326_c0_g1~~TRINITY_DN3326_c0_g1_i1.p1  ORF type:complete len:398 (-),score=62.20 TRINITY_DN3326_c0_g1_i1:22-1215(-)
MLRHDLEMNPPENEDDHTMRGSKEEHQPFILNDDTLSLASVYEETEYQPPETRFTLMFPISWEKRLQPFDDFVIKIAQKHTSKYLTWFDLAVTGVVAIETGICLPFIFFVLGWDGLATEISYLMLLLSFISQIPKRFVWRWRPYMVWRAQKTRRKETAVTSSFPSRAVTCGAVYSFVVGYAYIYQYQRFSTDSNVTLAIQWWMPLLILLLTLLSSFARINMGVHYPSDCLAGFLQAILVCVVGTALWHVDTLGCASCFTDACYSPVGSPLEIDGAHLHRINWLSLGIGIAVSILIYIVSVVKPIDFWGKCNRVYGMLFPGVLFQVVFLCGRTSVTSLAPPPPPPWYALFYALAFVGIGTAIGLKGKGKLSFVSFVLTFVLLFSGLVLWRLVLLPIVV